MTEESLFQEARLLPDAARAAFLEKACEGRPELRAVVEALLAAHDKSGHILDEPHAPARPEHVDPDATSDHISGQPADPDATSEHISGKQVVPSSASQTADFQPVSVPGALIAGRYALQEEIGAGGMGVVWVAKQLEPVKRKVALKLIKAGMDSRAVLQRFEQERQALAMMDHPNIAKVLDGGLTPTGQPFFVMELVNGLPLNRFCDELKLTTKDRLELFVPICQAVQHAHQKGIVHRDLKPANILVTMIDGKPVPKVIDFGVAKATAGKLTDESMSTQFGAIVGTLEYMSPEQAGFSGSDIDTRADIYSLGVILYELLTGLRPIDAKKLRKAALTEMIRIIQEEEPSKPSTRLSTNESLPSLAALRQIEPRRLMALLRGELDWVVMKCLEKHRERRYDTANALARDIQRYLADEAVEARPPSRGYRLGKFLRRNKGPVVAAALVLLSLLGGIIGTTQGLFEARRQEGIARNETKEKDKALQAEALQRAAAEKRLVQRDKANDVLLGVFRDLDPRRAENKDQPVAALLGKRLESAASQLEGEATSDPANMAKMQVALGVSQHNLSNSSQAISLFTKALAYYKETLGPDDENTISTSDKLAVAYIGAGRLELALPLWEETYARSRVKLGPDDIATLNCMANLAVGYYHVGKLDKAAVVGEEAHERLKQKFSGNYPGTLAVANLLVLTYRSLGKLDQAITLGEETLGLRMAVLGPNDPTVFSSMNNLALCYQQKGSLPNAIKLFEESLALTRQTLGSDHSDTLNSLTNLAEAYRASGNYEKALELSREAFTRMKTTHGRDHPQTLIGMANLARVYLFAGKLTEAIALHEEALALKRAKLGDEHEETVSSIINLGNAYLKNNQKERALALFEEAFAIDKRKYGADHPVTLTAMGNIALALLELDQTEKGFELLEECLRMSRVTKGADNPDTLAVLNNLGSFAWPSAEPTWRSRFSSKRTL